MALWTWWTGDALPSFAPLAGFRAERTNNVPELIELTGLDQVEITTRLGTGNRCYVARLGTIPVAYGWVTGAGAAIGELDVTFRLDGSDRYLWDFATLPAWRGRGIYPRLLQRILGAESRDGLRFWIINAPENVASASGIGKAGFRVAGDLAFAATGQPALVPTGDPDRARRGAAVLGVPLLDPMERGVSPCWRCVVDALRLSANAACWPMTALDVAPCDCGRPN